MKIQLKRSNVLSSGAAKTPTASQLEYGELAVNYNTSDPAIFLKDSNNNVIRISGVGNISDDGLANVPDGTTPPANPEAGNLWYNSDQGRLYIYFTDADSSQWVDASPDSWDPSSYPDTTNSSAQSNTLDDRYVMVNGGNGLKIDSSGKVGIGDTNPDFNLVVKSSTNTNANILAVKDSSGIKMVSVEQDSSGNGRLFVRDTSGNPDVLLHTNGNSYFNGGNVGIGTTSPAQKLDVSGAAVFGSGATRLTTYSDSTYGGIFNGSSLASDESIYMGGGATFFVSNGSERMRITSAGNVGIGATNPLRPLTISKAGAEGLEIGPGESSNLNLSLHFNRSSNVYVVNEQRASAHTFFIQGNEKARIDSSGNVGIGSTNPTGDGWSAANDLVINSTGNSGMTIKSGASSFGQLVFNDAAGGLRGFIAYGHSDDYLGFGTSGAERMRINSSGGIDFLGAVASGYTTGALIFSGGRIASYVSNSTTGTDPRLYVYNGTTSSYHARINANGSASFASTITAGSETTTGTNIYSSGSAQGIVSGVQKWYLAPSGSFQFGGSTDYLKHTEADGLFRVTSSSTKWNLAADGSATFLGSTLKVGSAAQTNLSDNGLYLRDLGSATSSTFNTKLDTNGSAIFSREVYGGNQATGGSSQSYGIIGYANVNSTSNYSAVYGRNLNAAGRVWTGDSNTGATTSEIYGNGNAIFSGSVSIGGTAAANTIDEYEEGTWTPVIRGGTSAGSTTHTFQQATYTKIGRLVHVRVYVQWNAATGFGPIHLGGLPYNISSHQSYGGPAINYWHLIGQAGNGVSSLWGIGSDHCYFYNMGSSSATGINLTSTGSIIVSGAYYTS